MTPAGEPPNEQDGHPQVWLDENEKNGQPNVSKRQDGVGELVDVVTTAGKELGKGDGQENSAEFRRLNFDKAQADPTARFIVNLPGSDDEDQGQHQPTINIPMSRGQVTVINAGHHEHGNDAGNSPVKLARWMLGQRRRAGHGAANHEDAISCEQNNGRCQPDVKVTPHGPFF